MGVSRLGLSKNKKGQFGLILLCIIIVWCAFVGGMVYDNHYAKPAAADAANNNCKAIGFDQYKSFSRVGIFSKVPVGIKCEYAEMYTDLGVRNN